ncbi:Ppx/GppA family phosphatase [Sphingomonas psychrotolerans]|uniref:Ppx/GppA family phosphatase n=1 Tax=Sphingomonas psychrotolerans TaxID=1327635 RepID=A0ABU3N097_9SPHN|nr:Ppx/GppA family phosphatase [Sphingomonas psychrotolerans]MDT8757960.1 Ppx/GppA family phosphatase [Sphingomonas psychrotolerans]
MATLLRTPEQRTAPAKARTAIIDIGSNSVRLVVYEGAARLPAVLFNEKVMAGLGRSLSETGAIDAEGLKRARSALARFAALAREMQAAEIRTVATAAVRDASNGGELMRAAEALGLDVELLSGVEEATASGMGVLSGIPDADGVVGDLGGGSLELVRVVAGTVTDRVSFPLGVLRLGAIRAGGKDALDRRVGKLIAESGWSERGKGLPFYLVGGSWRALARLDMHRTGYLLPVVHQYPIALGRVAELQQILAEIPRAELKAIPDISGARIPTLGDATALLASVLRHLGSSGSVVSAYGLREGLLYQRLTPEQRREDPLIAAARDEGERSGRFPEHGDLLDRWIAPLFDDAPELARLRHAACLLADVGWRANPEFRAERGMEIALHGNWVAIDAAGRAVLAQALYTALGGGTGCPDPLDRLADADSLAHARLWGLAIRLGQRLSGGVAAPLKRSHVVLEDGTLALSLEAQDEALYGEAVEKRHKALAAAFGREPVLEV